MIFFALSFFSAFFLAAQIPSERVLSLEDSIQLALLNNAPLLSSEQDILIAEQRMKEARYLFLPEISLSGHLTRFNADRLFALSPEFGSVLLSPSARDILYTGKASLRQSVYAGGRHSHTLNLTYAALQQARTHHETAQMDVVFQAKRVFYQLLYTQEGSRACQERRKEGETLTASPLGGWDWIESQGILQEIRSRCSQWNHELDLARLEYLRALGLELETRVQVKGELKTNPVNADLNKATVWALDLRPELRSEVFKAQMDAIAVNLAMSRRIPSIIFGADYELVGPDFLPETVNWDATLSIQFPLSYNLWPQIRQRRAEQIENRHG